MKSRLLLLMMLGCAVARGADDVYTYALGTPHPEDVTYGSAVVDGATTNHVFMMTASYQVFTNAVSSVNPNMTGTTKYALKMAEAGFAYERSKPQYYLADLIDTPDGVDWAATQALYEELSAEGQMEGFLFNPDETNPGVYAIKGGTQTFSWVLKDGSTNKLSYVISMATNGRPKRIYWTDSPYNAPLDFARRQVRAPHG